MKKENYLDKIPVKSDKISWEIKNESVTLEIENKGIVNRIFQMILKKPRISYIHLDEIGSFVWPLIDGEKSVFELGRAVEEKFGEKASPVYERLVQYFIIMDNHKFISWKK